MRLRLLAATAFTLGSLVVVPATAEAASPVPAAAPAAPAQARCNGLPKHSNLPVVDTARALDPQRSGYLTGDLMKFKMDTDIAIVAATVPNLGGDDIASYARRLFDCWGIGSAESDRGVLILVAMRERRVRVELGKGLAREVDRSTLDKAIAVMTAPMRRGDVAGAIREAAVVIAMAVGETLPDVEEFIRTNDPSALGDLGIPPIVLPGSRPTGRPTTGPITDAPPGDDLGGADDGDQVDGAPGATSPFRPSPIGDGRWIPRVMIGMVVLGVGWTIVRGVVRGFGGVGTGSWRGGFPTFGGGDRGWSDPSLLHDGRWSTDGSWLGGAGSRGASPLSSSGTSGWSGSGGSSGSSGTSGSPGGSSPFGGGSSGGGGASGSW